MSEPTTKGERETTGREVVGVFKEGDIHKRIVRGPTPLGEALAQKQPEMEPDEWYFIETSTVAGWTFRTKLGRVVEEGENDV